MTLVLERYLIGAATGDCHAEGSEAVFGTLPAGEAARGAPVNAEHRAQLGGADG